MDADLVNKKLAERERKRLQAEMHWQLYPFIKRLAYLKMIGCEKIIMHSDGKFEWVYSDVIQK
ncbi:MAG: hypothetical protein AAF571_03480, partial [Verrucomicrobiota bacterium]